MKTALERSVCAVPQEGRLVCVPHVVRLSVCLSCARSDGSMSLSEP